MLETRGCQPLVYLQNSTSATGEQFNFASSSIFLLHMYKVPEKAGVQSEAKFVWETVCLPLVVMNLIENIEVHKAKTYSANYHCNGNCRLTHKFKLKQMADLYVRSGEVMIFLTVIHFLV